MHCRGSGPSVYFKFPEQKNMLNEMSFKLWVKKLCAIFLSMLKPYWKPLVPYYDVIRIQILKSKVRKVHGAIWFLCRKWCCCQAALLIVNVSCCVLVKKMAFCNISCIQSVVYHWINTVDHIMLLSKRHAVAGGLHNVARVVSNLRYSNGSTTWAYGIAYRCEVLLRRYRP